MNLPHEHPVFRYRISLIILIFMSLISLTVIVDLIGDLQTISDYFFASFFVPGLVLILHFWACYLFTNQYVKILDDGIEFKTNYFIPSKVEFIRFEDINFIRGITSNGRTIEIQSDSVKICLNLWWMKVEDWNQLIIVLEKNLHSLKPLPFDELHCIFKKEKDFSSFWMWLAGTFLFLSIIFSSQFQKLDDFQLESQAYSNPIFIFSICLAFFIRKKFYSSYSLQIHSNQNKVNLNVIVFGLAVFLLGNTIGTFTNQKFDDSQARLRIVNIIKANESREYEKEHGPCFLLIDDNLKKADIEHKLCDQELLKASSSSKVLVRYKKGFLGQRWIAYIKVVD